MPNLSSITFDGLYCLFKGEPGTRKSTQALSFPLPQYWISWDRKMDALKIPMNDWNIDPEQVDFDDYNDWNSVLRKLESLAITCKYKSIIVDSITSGADAINRQTMRLKGADSKGKTIAGIPVTGFEEFNAEASALSELVALTKDINKSKKVNIILIAHVIQKEQKSPDGQTHMSRVLVTAGKAIAQKIPAYCSEVYHFNVKTGAIVGQGGQYALKTVHTGDDFARSSLRLDEEIIFGSDPLYSRWIKPAIDKINNQTNQTNQPKEVVTNASSPILKA